MTKEEWIAKCNYWKTNWQVISQDQLIDSDAGMNIYAVLDAVNRFSKESDIIVGDAGSISYAGPVALKAKPNQRFIFSPAQADMGWALPASIGVSLASNHRVISITGDGSLMSNMQEFAVIRKHNLNIKTIILNNGGYLSIKNTQTKFFEGRVFGTGSDSGLWFPKFSEVANCFNIEFKSAKTVEELYNIFKQMNGEDPIIIECVCMKNQEIYPAQAIKNGKQAPLHDMFPFLSEEELTKEIMINL